MQHPAKKKLETAFSWKELWAGNSRIGNRLESTKIYSDEIRSQAIRAWQKHKDYLQN